ncbi:conserved hypothetical protein [Mycolicibacterium vanbaalenii PYR-1]|uniref:Uncharacterized protein n=1 Tax=Mycolicibacterium vanbaalenii (strain DSM 7251 / JCM 13017 / BCRC 16820 / KCTC 9966 / NRRL B-24157 / PYR-1) TaxID=350058 RepID=A1T1V8_MYCVP|nr:conserved hypothetical protein [Mycolicibacterium vanbaalenii PYR-1]
MQVVKIAALNALLGGAALAAATQAGAQPAPVDPALPPAPPVVAAPAPGAPVPGVPAPGSHSVTVTPLDAGSIPPPAPPPVGAPVIPAVPNANFGNTGQLDFLRELWNMRNSAEFFQSVGPGSLDPATWQPPTPYGTPPPPPAAAPGSPPPPASAPPPVWPPVPVPAQVP